MSVIIALILLFLVRTEEFKMKCCETYHWLSIQKRAERKGKKGVVMAKW